MSTKAKQQALKDMTAEGISITFLKKEKEILHITATESSIKIDFRQFNGGHNKKQQYKKHK